MLINLVSDAALYVQWLFLTGSVSNGVFYLLVGGRAINIDFSFTFIPVHVQDLNCVGTESRLQDCQLSTDISSFCITCLHIALVECNLQCKNYVFVLVVLYLS